MIIYCQVTHVLISNQHPALWTLNFMHKTTLVTKITFALF